MTINDIAKLAGVSKATVSRYLNNGYISSEKKLIVEKIIRKTGFSPSSQARTLRTKKTDVIGVIIPKLSSESISKMVEGISAELKKSSHKILLADTANNEEEELVYLKTMQSYNVDGIILFGTVITDEHKKIIDECNIPIVILGQELQGQSSIYFDNFNAAKELTNSILKTSKKLAYINVRLDDRASGYARYDGFLSAISGKNKEYMSKEATFSIHSGELTAKKILKLMPDVDTIICATDVIAAGVIKYLKQEGKKIPEDIQVAGFGDTELGQVISPVLSTVSIPYLEAGKRSAKLLKKIIDNKIFKPEHIKISCKTVLRESTR